MNDLTLYGGGRTGPSAYDLYVQVRSAAGQPVLPLEDWVAERATPEQVAEVLARVDDIDAARDAAMGAQAGAEVAASAAGTAAAAAVPAGTAATEASIAAILARSGAEAAAEITAIARDGAVLARNEAQGARDRAVEAEGRAELAADTAVLAVDIYADTDAGLAGTALGQQFAVVVADEIVRYRHDEGPTATEVASYPSAGAVAAERAARIAADDGVADIVARPVIAATFRFGGSGASNALLVDDVTGQVLVAVDAGGQVVVPPKSLFRFGASDPAVLTWVADDGASVLRVDALGRPVGAWIVAFRFGAADLPDYIETDSDGRVLGGYYADGTAYISSLSTPSADFSALPQSEYTVDTSAGSSRLWNRRGAIRQQELRGPWYTVPRLDVYNSLAQYYAHYDQLVSDYPDYVTRSTLGADAGGNPIYQYAFTPPPKLLGSGISASLTAPPKIVLLAGVHGSEREAHIGTLIVVDNMCRRWRELEGYDLLRWSCRLVVIPAMVPSGVHAGSRQSQVGEQADINRNMDYDWGVNGTTTPGSPFYMGSSPLTQAEAVIAAGLPALHPDAIAWVDHHNHAGNIGGTDYFAWVGVDRPSEMGIAMQIIERIEAWGRTEAPLALEYGNGVFTRVDRNPKGGILGYYGNVLDLPAYLYESPPGGNAFSQADIRMMRRTAEYGLQSLLLLILRKELRQRQTTLPFTTE